MCLMEKPYHAGAGGYEGGFLAQQSSLTATELAYLATQTQGGGLLELFLET